MNKLIRLIVHLFFASITVFYFILCNLMMPHENPLVRLWHQHVFLTNLTHTLVTIYYVYVLYKDIVNIFGFQQKTQNEQLYTYPPKTHTYYQLILSMSMIVGLGYWTMMIIDPALLWGTLNPERLNVYKAMWYLHGGNHLHLYLEIFLYKQHVFVNKKKKFIIDFVSLSIYFTITAIQYFYFEKVVYNFQNSGIAVMIPVYILSTLAFTTFDFGFQAISTKIGLFKVQHDENKNQQTVKKQN